LGTWCWGERDPNPHGPAAVKLLALYEDLKGYLRAELDAQSCFKGDYDALSVTWNADTASFALDVSGVVSGLRREYAADAATTLEHLDALGSDLRRLGASGLDFLLALQSEGNAQGDAFAQALSTVGTVGTVGLVFNGTAGDDILVGNDADNYFHGLAGNDLMQGGEGNDTYYFNRGDGQDTILDLGESSQDSVRFGAGILASQVSVSRGTDSGCDDLILDLGSGDRLKPANDFCYIAPPQRPACAQALMH
jgi:Ca2+-binding RTX toxin-like protein